jgi:histone H3/H4
MTLFTNPNFIDHIVKSQAADSLIGQEHYALLQTLIELETRHLLETALKFMRRDRRDALSAEDLVQAAREQHHGEMVLLVQGAQYESKNEQIFRVDRTYASS